MSALSPAGSECPYTAPKGGTVRALDGAFHPHIGRIEEEIGGWPAGIEPATFGSVRNSTPRFVLNGGW